jgi:hypothetical protein
MKKQGCVQIKELRKFFLCTVTVVTLLMSLVLNAHAFTPFKITVKSSPNSTGTYRIIVPLYPQQGDSSKVHDFTLVPGQSYVAESSDGRNLDYRYHRGFVIASNTPCNFGTHYYCFDKSFTTDLKSCKYDDNDVNIEFTITCGTGRVVFK